MFAWQRPFIATGNNTLNWLLGMKPGLAFSNHCFRFQERVYQTFFGQCIYCTVYGAVYICWIWWSGWVFPGYHSVESKLTHNHETCTIKLNLIQTHKAEELNLNIKQHSSAKNCCLWISPGYVVVVTVIAVVIC